MQPLPFGENGACKRKEKSAAGAGVLRAEPRETAYFS
jgi:hypothetical protein